MCGEQNRGATVSRDFSGSSPRVRGTGTVVRQFVTWVRFIPACAGNSPYALRSKSFRPVHPRVCGEQDSWRFLDQRATGSSPRVRGTDAFVILPGNQSRFIPACAGNRLRFRFRNIGITVHPRVCGEQQRYEDCARINSGSSPRVRGTGTATFNVAAGQRFIPACAGNSLTLALIAFIKAVHPRVCGEQTPRFSATVAASGSSPRVRGTVLLDAKILRQKRFIPACAGNSRSRAARHPPAPVHPRVCGEQSLIGSGSAGPAGSSPRVRGTDRPTLRT